MKYKFQVMTDFKSNLESFVENFNKANATDLKLLGFLDDEAIFAEMETSMSNELLFRFGVEFGKRGSKINIEGGIEFRK
ncbi:MAG: hypothetical protein IPO40_20435 [Fibrobacteres bacterium]|nr:hypothetical protein [Fibrobacterota bacterium]